MAGNFSLPNQLIAKASTRQRLEKVITISRIVLGGMFLGGGAHVLLT